MAAYIEANAAGDGVAFYANKWSGGEDGDVLAAFTPAKSNSYYYMTEETPIYTDEACTVPAKGALNADGTYYYKRSWYDIGNGQAKPQSGAIQFPGNISESLFGYIGTDASGNAVFKPGTPRITYIDELRTPKDSNPTATATTVLNPLWSGSSVACHLGNNGKLVIEKPGTLAISKSLVVPEGYDRADFANDTFTFTIEIDKAEGQEFPAEVRDVNNEPVGDAFTIAFDNSGPGDALAQGRRDALHPGFERGLGIPRQRAAYDWFRSDSSRGEQRPASCDGNDRCWYAGDG